MSCNDPFVNEKTTQICPIDIECLKKNARDSIKHIYGISDDSILNSKKQLFYNYPFKIELLFFSDSIQEIIGVDEDHYSVRCLYNPKISDKVLNGLSEEIDDTQRKRIFTKVYKLLSKYQCDRGKISTYEKVREVQKLNDIKW